MRRGFAVAVVLIAGCAPALTQIGRDHYRIECDWFAECKARASRLCPDGYSIEEAKDAHAGSFLVARCKARHIAVARPPTPPPEPTPEPEERGPKVECVRDFQCAKPGARCVDGKCVAPAPELRVDETDPCVIGASAAGDPTPIFPTEKAAAEFAVVPAGGSKASILDLVSRLQGTWVDPGVRCKTFQTRTTAKYVQLLSGPATGREGWLWAPPNAMGDAGVR
jgi:hypothetical protein